MKAVDRADSGMVSRLFRDTSQGWFHPLSRVSLKGQTFNEVGKQISHDESGRTIRLHVRVWEQSKRHRSHSSLANLEMTGMTTGLPLLRSGVHPTPIQRVRVAVARSSIAISECQGLFAQLRSGHARFLRREEKPVDDELVSIGKSKPGWITA
ncbi:MAG: hypothetical protein ACRD2L_20890 [Terriglobia bacterium]